MSSTGHSNTHGASSLTRRRAYLAADAADPAQESTLSINKRGELVEEYPDNKQTPAKPKLVIRRLGFTASQRDRERAMLLVREQMRREGFIEGSDAPGDVDREAFDKEADKRLNDLSQVWHPDLPKQYEKVMQVSHCPDRKPIRDHVEVKAIRQLPEVKELEALLSGCDYGRPTNRKLPVATLLRLMFGDCDPEIRAALKEFEGSNLELDWAYLDLIDPEEIKPLLRDETALRRTLKAMAERNSPDVLWEKNASIMDRMRMRHSDVGRFLAVDATSIEAHLVQVGDASPELAKLLNRGTGAAFGHHGGRNRRPKSWRGWKLLLLIDLKTGLVLVGLLIPANAPEYPYITELLDKAFALMPWLDPEYLVADSEMDRATRLAFDLQSRYGITPVFDLRDNVSQKFDWADSDGVPSCSKHGLMHLQQVELGHHRAVPIAYVEDFEEAKKAYNGRMRWFCKGCRDEGVPVREETWIRRNARIYTGLPRKGEHWRAALRQALMLRRNHSESFNSQLKLRGIGGRNQTKARWVTKEVHMQWLAYGAAISPTLRREAHESGAYAEMAADAEALGLVKKKLVVPKHSALREADAGPRGQLPVEPWRCRKAA